MFRFRVLCSGSEVSGLISGVSGASSGTSGSSSGICREMIYRITYFKYK